MATVHQGPSDLIDSPASWRRLAISLALGTIGGIGLWSFVVSLPAIQAEFGATRAEASLPYTLLSIGFAVGGLLMGRLADRFGVVIPALLGTGALSLGFLAAGLSTSLWQFALAHGLLIGIGASATFGPLMADVSHWFARRRGIAVSVVAAGNYFAGTLWPPIVQYFIATIGWRLAHIGIGVFCLVAMLPLIGALRRRSPRHHDATTGTNNSAGWDALGVSPTTLQTLLAFAAITCCVAMPQVHIVAYCGDLGYGPARGAEMLSLMLGFGIVSRIASGFVADRIGGVATFLVGSTMQAIALLLYLLFDGLGSLYVISALFGLFQGGIVPSYAIIVREYFSPYDAATRVGLVLMASLFGMALGGWMSGFIFDLTGSYQAAFANGSLWNLLNVSIALWLLLRSGRRLARA